MAPEGWVRVRRRNGWHIQHFATGEERGPIPSRRTAGQFVAALNFRLEREGQRKELAARRKEIAGFVRSIRNGETHTIAALADWQEERGRTDNSAQLRAIFGELGRVTYRRAGPRDRIAPDERLRSAVIRDCTRALRIMDDWWIRHRQNKELVAERAAVLARAIVQAALPAPCLASVDLALFAHGPHGGTVGRW